MRHTGPLLALCLLIAGCSVDLVEPPDRVCSVTEPCQEGQVCQDGVCRDAVVEGDGGTDGGTDAGTDAGTGADGGSDAGTDAGVTITVQVLPAEVEVASLATQQFTAEVSGSSEGVIWSVQEGATGGTIDATGLYTAPEGHGTFHVVASSVEDSKQKAVALVTVPRPRPDVPGLVAHYSAGALLGQDVALPLDGSLVTTWADLSGSGRTLSQGIPSRQPAFKRNGPNGRPAVVFDGTTDALASALFAAALPQPNTVVVVFEGPSGVCTLLDAPQGTNERNRIQLGGLEGSVGVQMYATNFSQPGAPVRAGVWHIATLVFNATSSIQRVDGAPQSVNTTNLGTAGMGGILLGLKQDQQPAVDPGQPVIAELLVFNRALESSEILALESWLVSHYGL